MNRYWIGGTGTWNASDTTHWSETSGGAGGASVPTSTDDVIFNNLSHTSAYVVTISASSYCKNFTLGAPASGKVELAGSSSLSVYGNFNLSGGDLGVLFSHTGYIYFKSTTTGNTITINGVTGIGSSGEIVFSGSGGEWTLQDSLVCSRNIRFTEGTFNSNNQTINIGSKQLITGTSLLVLNFGSSTITCGSVYHVNSNNLTFNSGTSSIIVNGNMFQSYGLTWYNVTVNGSTAAYITGINTFNNLTITSGASIRFDASQTINGTLTINGTSTNRMLVYTSVYNSHPASTLTAANVSFSYVDFQNIVGAGAANWDLSSITGLSGDCGGNSGITFTTPSDQHWISSVGGNWSDSYNWTSRVPLPQDDVYMDHYFGTGNTVSLDVARGGKTIDWTGATWTTSLRFRLLANSSIFGSLKFINNLTIQGTISYKLYLSGLGDFYIDGANVVIGFSIEIDSQDVNNVYRIDYNNLVMDSGSGINIVSGSFSTNNYNLTTGSFTVSTTSSRSSVITLDGSVIEITGMSHLFTNIWNISTPTVVTLSTTGSTIKFTYTGSYTIDFKGGSKIYNNVFFEHGSGAGLITISGSNTFNELKDSGTAAHSLKFSSNSIQRIRTWNVNGNIDNLITVNVSSVGTFKIVKVGLGDKVSADYLNIQHCIAMPSNTWYAGTHSVDNQGVSTEGSGWTFSDPPALGLGKSFFLQSI